MTLVEFVPPTPHPLWKLCPQMGITDVVVKVNPDLTGLPDPWRYETLAKIVGRLKDAGLNVVGLEGDPFDMSSIKEYGARVGENSSSWRKEEQNPLSNSNSKLQLVREEALEHYCELLESMGKLGIKLLCYNFMVGKGWSRTGVREVRGGAKATYFSLRVGENSSSWRKEEQIQPSNSNSKLQLNAEQVWANYEYFIKAVMPTAEKCGVRMALHPDDPCLPSLGGYARIFGSVESYDRAYALYPSPSNAITFCQANFKLMLGGSGSSEFEFESGCKTPFSNSNSKLQLNAEQVWANYEYFIKAVMPTAEKCGVRMALHPDDPCLPSLGGYARIFGSVEAYDRAYALYPSPSNAITFCQANFKLMLGNGDWVMGTGDCFGHKEQEEQKRVANSTRSTCSTRLSNPVNPVNPVRTLEDAARHFGKRIAFIHVRDVEGTKEDFTELFHDQGDTDQFALMRTYRELGLDVPVRGDHVPEMAYDRELTPEGTPGYFTLGRLFANGYLKALLKGTLAAAH